jgi:hypothetical protein
MHLEKKNTGANMTRFRYHQMNQTSGMRIQESVLPTRHVLAFWVPEPKQQNVQSETISCFWQHWLRQQIAKLADQTMIEIITMRPAVHDTQQM